MPSTSSKLRQIASQTPQVQVYQLEDKSDSDGGDQSGISFEEEEEEEEQQQRGGVVGRKAADKVGEEKGRAPPTSGKKNNPRALLEKQLKTDESQRKEIHQLR